MDFDKKVVQLDINDILPNRFQPRIKFNEESINELCESIREHGVIQPIVVRKMGDKFEIIAGERRFKASLLAGKNTIPAVITELNDKDSAEVALIENVQRRDLTPIEEAISYKKVLDMGFMTQEDLAKKLGKTQSTVANKLRLLNLDEEVQEALLEEKISERHARSLLRLSDTNQQKNMLNKIISERLTVRKTDDLIAKIIKGENVLEPQKSDNITQTKENVILNNNFLPTENLLEKNNNITENVTEENTQNLMGNISESINSHEFSSDFNPHNFVELNENEIIRTNSNIENNVNLMNENINVNKNNDENYELKNNNIVDNFEENNDFPFPKEIKLGKLPFDNEDDIVVESLPSVISNKSVEEELYNPTTKNIVSSYPNTQSDIPMIIPSYPDMEEDEAVPTFGGNVDNDFINIPTIEEKHDEPIVIIEEEPKMNNEQYVPNNNFMNQNMQFNDSMMNSQQNEFNPFDLSNNNVSNNDFNIPSSPIEDSSQMGYSYQNENNYNDNNNFIPLSANNLGIEEPLVSSTSYDNSSNPGFMDIDKIEKQAVDINNFGQLGFEDQNYNNGYGNENFNNDSVYNVNQEMNNVEIFPSDVPILRPTASEGNVQNFEEKRDIQPGKFFSLPLEEEVDKNQEIELESNPFEFGVANMGENTMTLNLDNQPKLKTLDDISQFRDEPMVQNPYNTSSLMNEQNNMINSMNNTNNPVNQFGLPVQESFVPQQPLQVQPNMSMQNPTMGYGFAPQQVMPTQTMIPPADQNNMNMASYMNQSMMMQPQMAQPTKNINMAYAAIKECVQKIQALGFNVNTEDFDFENMYQIMFRIEK
jgi:ParB family chromosome partitioning protein